MSDCSHGEDTFEFVDEPDSDYFCPVCQDLLTEPFQLECGHQLCRICRDRLLSSNKTECPTCRDSDALSNAHFDKFLKRKVSSVRIHCQHHKEGCEWVGEVRDLQYHFDHNVVACPFGCGKRSCQVVIKKHKGLCLNRPIGCDNCDYYNTFAIVKEKHNPKCLQSPVDCPNHCPAKGLKRSQLEQHFNECTHQLVNCSEIGCSVWLPRGEIELHKMHIRQHDLLLVKTNQASATITPSFRYLHNQPPIEFVIPNFLGMKDANAKWKSPLIFTHEKGYKFHLEVYPNGWGSGQGTHISVYVSLIGDYDSDVALVSERDVVVELLNWKADKNHLLATLNFSRNHNDSSCHENAPGTPGTPHFISYSSLCHPDTNTEYLQDDCLRVRVVDVAVYSTPLLSKTPSWQDPHTATQSVCEFTLTEFTKRKQFNNEYYSQPFYSHPNGYKLCLQVYANGSGDGKGTHISIYASLMRGDYDNNLQWPFEGDIVIELLNWRENNNHYREDTIDLNKYNDPDGSVTSRVTKGQYAPMTFGQLFFISHSSLLYNPDTNTEYLQDDCLRLRVVVAVYSTPLLLKTPSWQDPHTATQSVCEFTLTEFTKRKQFNNVYYSQPFYSHPNGYKLCLKVYVDGSGNGKGTHISIFASLMRGDYDNNLQWPFEGDIVIELLNWRENNNHYRGNTIELNKYNNPDGSGISRVTQGKYAPSKRGKIFFISHSSLLYNPDTNTEYLQDDCLRLRVVDVTIYSTPLLLKTPSWQDPHTATQSVCEFTLTEFTKRNQFNNEYYCQPFYSHPNGYKLCLRVDVNGNDKGKGTHISIYATLMRGDYDNNLQWPFESDVLVEILNWRDDRHHYRGDTMSINKHGDLNGHITSRVTDGEYASNSLTDFCFISHSSLSNPDKNTEYLQDDCLRLRVVDVAVYSTPLLLKIPSWQGSHTATQSVCEFTLTEFAKRTQFDNMYFGPSFHTHFHGYKMLLVLYANGRGTAKGTHISVCVTIIIRKYDSGLNWPFEGDIIVELVNWREDKNHLSHTIVFDDHTDPKFSSRVTEGSSYERHGSDDVFLHSSLSYNPVTNTEYLQDDCLRFRVKEVNMRK